MQLNFATRKENKRKTLDGEWSAVIHNPPESVTPMIWSQTRTGSWVKVPKKVYLTANIWYGTHGHSKNERIIRAVAKDTCLIYMNSAVNSAPYCTGKIKLTVIYYSPKKTFDMDNKGYFWGKLFQDYLVKRERLISDTVEYVEEVHYIYKNSVETKVEFKLLQL